MAQCCVRAFVTGKVQGVWYRRATQEQALLRGVTGYAKNLPDGRVEVLMCGQVAAVSELGQWLWQGPQGAQVTHVTLETLENQHAPDHFSTY
ncbi:MULTISPECIES: acylphosphatase [Halomonadaceae]|jgi:acylphosphatase|uniref:acylphosphatase n=1 Tax=Halomonadaceae TaxID=28256 RepID=UPI001C630E66|nr:MULTISPECIES: acylphosphatase [Halomonas]MCG7575299.1 acylphosphatase [Halomonas sp. MMH1-48]MCG7602361.1 acylphosphatase [Halomonas sp. MM17-34]MCG7611881.1 acylphosphatase [Halomonas sp. MM17-29]MCG7618762.1 acylphosphatase [Halomonas sp. DSH1-27]BCB62363.1 acylphosphatase [Halomonas sp. A020]